MTPIPSWTKQQLEFGLGGKMMAWAWYNYRNVFWINLGEVRTKREVMKKKQKRYLDGWISVKCQNIQNLEETDVLIWTKLDWNLKGTQKEELGMNFEWELSNFQDPLPITHTQFIKKYCQVCTPFNEQCLSQVPSKIGSVSVSYRFLPYSPTDLLTLELGINCQVSSLFL